MGAERRVVLLEMDESDAEICATALGVYTGVASADRALKAGDLLDRIETAVQIETQPGGVFYPPEPAGLRPVEARAREIRGAS